MELTTIIMAAGKGKRMKNPDKSKVMYELNGKPLIEYVMELSLKIKSSLIIPVVGHQKQSVIDFISTRFSEEMSRIKFAHQDEQLGTGHAIMQTRGILKDFSGNALILSGDVPLLRYETVNKFIGYHNTNNFSASLISAIFGNPFGYGRIIRDGSGKFIDIKEEKDATEEQRKIREINSGIYVTDCRMMFSALDTIRTDNAQGEYYLTDIFGYFRDNNASIGALPVDDNKEITGINTIEQLNELNEQITKLQ